MLMLMALTTKHFAKRWCSTKKVLPFDSIPGPPGKGLPFIGHVNLYIKKPHGLKKSWKNLKEIRKQYLKEDDKLLRLHLPPFCPSGNVVLLLDPADVEDMYRHEGKYPYRGSAFEPWIKIKKRRRPDEAPISLLLHQ